MAASTTKAAATTAFVALSADQAVAIHAENPTADQNRTVIPAALTSPSRFQGASNRDQVESKKHETAIKKKQVAAIKLNIASMMATGGDSGLPR